MRTPMSVEKLIRLSQQGMSTVGVLTLVGLLGILSSGIMFWNAQRAKLTKQLTLANVADQIKSKLVSAVMTPQSWQIIENKNQAAMSYVQSAGGNGLSHPPKLDIYLADSSSPYYASSRTDSGFDTSGNVCSGFNLDQPNDNCPFRYEIVLKSRIFQNQNWIQTVSFKLVYSASNKLPVFNSSTTKYSFDLVRNFNEGSVESSCIALNGRYNANTKSCSVTLTPEKKCENRSWLPRDR